jgi:hypothetical protein
MLSSDIGIGPGRLPLERSPLRFVAWSIVETIVEPRNGIAGTKVPNIKCVGGGEYDSDHVEFNGIVTLRGITASDRSAAINGQTEDCLRHVGVLLALAGTSKARSLTSTVYLERREQGRHERSLAHLA